jgi:hypothetical protein
MYEQFTATDPWTGETLTCHWMANMLAIATRHTDAVDVRFDVNGHAIWISLPNIAWKDQKQRAGLTITDYLTAQIAGRFLKQQILEGFDPAREFYAMSVAQVLTHLDTIVDEAKIEGGLPSVPVVI